MLDLQHSFTDQLCKMEQASVELRSEMTGKDNKSQQELERSYNLQMIDLQRQHRQNSEETEAKHQAKLAEI